MGWFKSLQIIFANKNIYIIAVGFLISSQVGNFMNTRLQRTPCEVYSRIVGYIRPVNQWNKGKRAEFADRKEFNKQLAA